MISVVGHTAVDHICKVSHLPGPNASASILERTIAFGGGAANIAVGIALLGGRVSLISAVGGDFAGSAYDSRMKELGIDQRFFIAPEKHTATAFMFTGPEGDQMTYFEWGASYLFETEKAPSLPFVHMATADPGFNVQVAKQSGFASFDPGQDLHRYTADHLNTILDSIDLLIANHHEYAGMCKTLGIDRDELISRVPMAIETRSGDGAVLYDQGKEHFIPAVPVPCVDPTGAGDAFRAGFLTAYAAGYSSEDACRIGVVTASFVVETCGCQTGLPNWQTMVRRYGEKFGPFPSHGPKRA
ncbi:inosine-guanosine kinase / cytidine kinase [Methanospirillum hungatei JF-1]|uniref:Inosine-guanosine kinase / cytidine kinase n=1 Tax=Methanospirillum hungatei JF-1 (strain ATCC 27890 / DSM 864 / NBRC 100397 / JF-1) TaxID=323259 RepID=Q2FQN7_METHJ|nr:carbohydrate kinase family protein [Methanospirillum hungatei]ABD39855.1 inosine-guanosine kinase / cytidine kinase [Methanospirillum hungatei JF-1]